jgi:hypothetical protein
MNVCHEIPQIDQLRALLRYHRERERQLQEFAMGLAERLAAAAEVLSILAEKKHRRNA